MILPCSKFQNDLTNEKTVIGKRNLTRLELTTNIGNNWCIQCVDYR